MKYLLLGCLVFVCDNLLSQSDFDLSQRWFNESLYNPAAMANSYTNINLHSRAQWVMTDGAPITNAASVDTHITDLKSSMGLAVITDQIGYFNSWSAKFNYAYYIPISSFSLSFGLSGYVMNKSSSVTADMAENPADPRLGNSRKSEYKPDFDFGIELKGPFKLGVSARHIVASQSVNSMFPPQTVNIWAYLSSRFNIASNVSLEPTVSYTYRKNISRIEGGLIFYFFKTEQFKRHGNSENDGPNDRFWLGGMFQYKDQVAILAGISITPKIKLGYSFNYGISDLMTISKYGTHELFFSLRFKSLFEGDKGKCPAHRVSGGAYSVPH